MLCGLCLLGGLHRLGGLYRLLRLPGTLEAAIHALEADPVVTAALGEHITTQYVTGKLREWEEYRTQVSQWELEKYLVTY